MEVAEWLTLVITTAPAIANPSTFIIESQFKSIVDSGLSECQVVLCFDGNEVDESDDLLDVKCKRLGSNEDIEKYELYKTAARKLATSMLPRVKFAEAPRRLGLTHNLKNGVDLVTTKYIFVIQDDLILVRPADFKAIIKTMYEDSDIKLVRFVWGTNRLHQDVMHTHYSPVTTPEFVGTWNGITLSRSSQYSDNNHIASVDYYHSLVFPITLKQRSFMEHSLVDLPARGLGAHKIWGTWYYGAYEDGHYLQHLDSRYYVGQ
jgi:glycosyltransferase involved in cell wall biosynthesis